MLDNTLSERDFHRFFTLFVDATIIYRKQQQKEPGKLALFISYYG
jgi:hypothetical protein